MSGFTDWDQLSHAEDWVLFPENLGEYLSINETSVSQGEFYTILPNKAAKGKKGVIVAIVKGMNSEKVSQVLKKKTFRTKKQGQGNYFRHGANYGENSKTKFS